MEWVSFQDSQSIYQWGQQTFTPSLGYVTSHCIGINKNNKQKKMLKKSIKNILIPLKYFDQRKVLLQNFKHENYIPVCIDNIFSFKQNEESFVNSFNILSQYIENSTSLQVLIREKKIMQRRTFISIIQQVVDIMSVAEKENLYHYKLKPSSVLILQKQYQKNLKYLIKICDWQIGNYGFESKNQLNKAIFSKYHRSSNQPKNFQYTHPHLLFKNSELEGPDFEESQNDIWSFGVILYKLKWFKHPFQNNNEFDLSKLQEFYKNKKQIKIQEQDLLSNIIGKMLSLNQFKTWDQVKSYLIDNAQLTQIDFWQPKELFQKYYSLMSYFIEIYKLIIWCICNSGNCFWYENAHLMKKCLLYLLQLMYSLQNHKFKERFYHSIQGFDQMHKKSYNRLSALILEEWSKLTQKQENFLNSMNFFQLLSSFKECLLAIQIKISDYQSPHHIESNQSMIGTKIKDSWPSMKHIKVFSHRMIQIISSIENRDKNIFLYLFNLLNFEK